MVASLPAGTYPIEIIWWERAGGESLEVTAAPGNLAVFTPAFDLVGDTANGGLSVLTTPGGGGGSVLVNTDIGAQMLNVNSTAYVRVPFNVADRNAIDILSFTMGYNDGFVAYLNGTEIASRNAPGARTFNSTATATRTPAESTVAENFDISAFQTALVDGSNVLAIHGLNVAASDRISSRPALSGGGRVAGGPFYFRQSTPGTSNTPPGFLGQVADTNFRPIAAITPRRSM